MRAWVAFSCAVILCVVAELGIRPIGDGGEYLLATHAFATRATPEIRLADVEWAAAYQPELQKLMRAVRTGMERGDLTPASILRRGGSGAHYTLHFWFYSLVCAPFLWLTELLELSPVYALGLVNGLSATIATIALWFYGGRGRTGAVLGGLFLLNGTMLYLGCTGPEVFTGACVVLACVLGRRRQLGYGLLATALAATQNPTSALLALYVGAWCWPRRREMTRRDLALALLAVGLMSLPYVFCFVAFGVPSPILYFAMDFSLIGAERAWSLLFDLNEGMIIGLPGLLVTLPLAAAFAFRAAPRSERVALGLEVGGTLLLVIAMAIPTLAIHNWNSAAIVFIRYGYWLSMPLLVLFVDLIGRLEPAPRSRLVASFVALQVGVLGLNGVVGERSSYVRHSWAAKLVLSSLPSAYNPVPEIFYERSMGWEPVIPEDVVVWPYRGTPGKLMVRGDVPQNDRVCPDGGIVRGARVHPVSDGWRYLDPPFRCEPMP